MADGTILENPTSYVNDVISLFETISYLFRMLSSQLKVFFPSFTAGFEMAGFFRCLSPLYRSGPATAGTGVLPSDSG